MDSLGFPNLAFTNGTLKGFALRSVSREWLNYKFGPLSVPEWDALTGRAADYKTCAPILFAVFTLDDGTEIERPASEYAGRQIGSVFPLLVHNSVNAYSTR